MGTPYKLLKDLSDQNRRWTAKVKVTKIIGPSYSKDRKTLYKRFTLMDEEGAQIQATMFESEFETFEQLLQLNKVYYISRAFLRKYDGKYKPTNCTDIYQMIIKPYTQIVEAENDLMAAPPKKFNFSSLSQFMDDTISTSRFDIVAIVIDVPSEERRKRKADQMDISFRNLIVTDTSLRRLTITTWDHFIHDECQMLLERLETFLVIIVTELQKKEIYGSTIASTTHASEIIFDSDLSEVKELTVWKETNRRLIEDVRQGKGSASNTKVISIEDILKVADIGNVYSIKASLAAILQQDSIWYMSCDECHKKTTASHLTQFKCDCCQKQPVTTTPCMCVRVKLADDTGNISATFFGQVAETFFSTDVSKLMNMNVKEQHDLLDKWELEFASKKYLFRAKLSQGISSLQLGVLNVEEAE